MRQSARRRSSVLFCHGCGDRRSQLRVGGCDECQRASVRMRMQLRARAGELVAVSSFVSVVPAAAARVMLCAQPAAGMAGSTLRPMEEGVEPALASAATFLLSRTIAVIPFLRKIEW